MSDMCLTAYLLYYPFPKSKYEMKRSTLLDIGFFFLSLFIKYWDRQNKITYHLFYFLRRFSNKLQKV